MVKFLFFMGLVVSGSLWAENSTEDRADQWYSCIQADKYWTYCVEFNMNDVVAISDLRARFRGNEIKFWISRGHKKPWKLKCSWPERELKKGRHCRISAELDLRGK